MTRGNRAWLWFIDDKGTRRLHARERCSGCLNRPTLVWIAQSCSHLRRKMPSTEYRSDVDRALRRGRAQAQEAILAAARHASNPKSASHTAGAELTRFPKGIILDHEIVVLLAGAPASFGVITPRISSRAIWSWCARSFPTRFVFSVEGSSISRSTSIWLRRFPPSTDDPRRRRPYEVQLGNTLELPVFASARRAPWIRQSVLRLLDEWARGTVLDVLAAQAELLLLLVRLARLSKEATPDTKRTDSSAEAAVRRALAETARFGSVRDLARAAGVSASHLRRVVRGWVGQSPAAYLRQEQVSRARRLLADPRRSIKSVAFESGFASPHHFSRVFRRIDGLSPSEYRAAILAGDESGED